MSKIWSNAPLVPKPIQTRSLTHELVIYIYHQRRWVNQEGICIFKKTEEIEKTSILRGKNPGRPARDVHEQKYTVLIRCKV